MTTTGSQDARELARQLLEREQAGATEALARGEAMQRALDRVAESLRRSVGDDGYTALLTRAFESAQSDRPLLKEIRLIEADGVHLDVVGGVDNHGAEAMLAALVGLLAAMVDILSDLIGADMVRRLLDQEYGHHAPDARRPE